MKRNSIKSKVALLVALALLLVGCGLKANPVPYATEKGPDTARATLAVSIQENAVLAEGKLVQEARRWTHIRLDKSDLGAIETVCSDCPRTYSTIGRLPVNRSNPEFRFTDADVQNGRAYAYRIQWCDENAVCVTGPIADIEVK